MTDTELIDETGRTVFRGTQVGGGGSQPGALCSADLLFTEEADAGTYTATLDVPEGTVVIDVIQYALAAPWAADGVNAFGMGATLNVKDGTWFYVYQADLAGVPFDTPYTLPTLQVAGTRQGWSTLADNTDGNDYGQGAYSQDDARQTFAGPGIRYASGDTITATVETALAGPPVVPTGVLLVKVLYFAPVTAVAASFA